MANSDPSEWRLIDTDLVTVLGILPASESHLYLVLNEPGSGELKIPLGSALAGSVESGMFAQATYRGAVRGGFFVENISKGQADAAEGGGQWVSISGRGALSLLDDAIVWSGGTTDSTRDFAGMTKAAILITLITEAQARGALANLSYDFTAVLDSDGVAWTDSENYKLNVGSSLLDITRQFARTGIDFDILPGTGDFVLSAYKLGKGSDKSETVYLRTGVNCEEVTSDEHGDKIKNAQLIAYKGGYISVSDAVSIAARRRREKLLDLKMAQTASSATTIGAAEVELRKDPQKSISVKIYDGAGPRGFVDYDLGDYIMLDVQGTETRYRIYGMQPDWKGDQFSTVIVELNSILYENDIQLAQDVAWLLDQWSTANDADLIEVSYWAAIGDANTDYSSVMMVVAGGALYLINGAMSNRMMRFTFGTGVWEVVTVALGTINCMEVIGTTIYLGGQSVVYKFETSTDTLSTIAAISYAASPALTGAYTMAVDGTTLYIAGAFDTIDGVAANGIIEYDTVADTWATLADEASFTFPTVASTSSMVFANGNLYANGQMWNGTVFSSTSKPGTIGFCYKMIAYGTDILIGTEDGLYIYDGVSWEVFGGTIAGQVRDIAIYLTDIYIVGTFTDIGNRIAKYSGGAWWQLGTGLNGSTTQIELVDDDVYVMGSFTTAGDKIANNIAAYFSNFESMVDYLENSSSSFNMGAAIHAAAASSISDSDEIPFWEDVANALRKITWANIKATLKTYFDTLYVALTGAQTIAGVKTFSSDPIIPDEAYDATAWNGVLEPPTKNAVRDKIESMGGSGTPGGSDTQVQFNDGGAFGGESDFTFNKTTNALEIGGAIGSGNSRFQINDFGDSTTQPSYKGYKAGGTFGIPTAVLANYILMRYGAGGYDGVTPDLRTGSMTIVANENFSGSAHGTRIDFFTTPEGSTVITKSFTVGADGNVNIGSGKTYNVNGSPHVHTAAEVAAIPNDGWIAISATGTSGTLDAPSFEISFNADMTGLIGLGDRIKITQSTTKYFIVTKVGTYSAGATVITCYGGTDYTLVASGTTAITNPYFSHVKVPFGFPVSPSKWTVTKTDTSNASQATPTNNTWYNLGGINIIAPIGVWNMYYFVAMEEFANLAAVSNRNIRSTLSTANNSESDAGMTVNHIWTGAISATSTTRISLEREKVLTVASKTTYYLNGIFNNATAATSIAFRGDGATTTILFVCAYL